MAAQAAATNEVIASSGAYYDGQQVNFTAVIVIASGISSRRDRGVWGKRRFASPVFASVRRGIHYVIRRCHQHPGWTSRSCNRR